MYVGAQLAPERRELDLDWAENVGDETAAHEFEVPTDDAFDGYVGIQAFDVGAYGHEILINGDPMSGFDIPPNDGWQYWVDTFADAVSLTEGTNALRIARDVDSDDAFAVGTVTVHWKEPEDA
ncbi:hypothetical protein ACFR97_10450 [Haloplanus litoreus]|uniref:Uncharacterized protein n=1 Tax=Haloplanus litoreus TaxID=767515 RepID=A0ABD6A1S0_9EURY